MDIEVTNSPELSVVEPQSVPSRISVVLVEEAGGTPRLGCPRVDQDLRLLAGMAKPASVTACEDSHKLPCVGGMLSSSDLAGRLFPVVPAGIPFPVGPVDPAGPDGPYVASDPVGPYGTLSPFVSDPAGPAGPDGPYVAGGPVGPYGTLSPSDSEPDGSVGQYVAGGPVGPDGTLSLFISDPDGPYVAGGFFASSYDHTEQTIKTPQKSHPCVIAKKIHFKMAATPFELNLVLPIFQYWKLIKTWFWWLYPYFLGQGIQ